MKTIMEAATDIIIIFFFFLFSQAKEEKGWNREWLQRGLAEEP